MPKIPKIIHFIWVGPNPLPDKYIENILTWAAQNPSFQVKIWVDKKSAVETVMPADAAASSTKESDFEKGLKVQKTSYKESFPRLAEKVLRERLPESSWLKKVRVRFGLSKEVKSLLSRVTQTDIAEEGFNFPEIRYEIDRLQPNYGAASDLLRYAILERFGGCYFDTDVTPGAKTLESESKLFDVGCDLPVLYYFSVKDGRHQGDPTNDTLLCVPHDSTIKMLFSYTFHNYKIRDALPECDVGGPLIFGEYKLEFPQDDPRLWGLMIRSFDRHLDCVDKIISAYSYGRQDFLVNYTLYKTGPTCLKFIIGSVDEERTHSLNAALRVPKIVSDCSWVDRCLHVRDSAEAISRAVAAVVFEVENQGILRLDYHIDCIDKTLSLSGDEPTSPKIVDQFLSRLWEQLQVKGLIGEKIGVAQLTFHYPQTLAFYQRHSLLDKTFLFPNEWNDDAKQEMKKVFCEVCEKVLYAFSSGGKRASQFVDSNSTRDLVRSFEFLDGLLKSCEERLLTYSLLPNPQGMKVVQETLKFVRTAFKAYEVVVQSTEILEGTRGLLAKYPEFLGTASKERASDQPPVPVPGRVEPVEENGKATQPASSPSPDTQ